MSHSTISSEILSSQIKRYAVAFIYNKVLHPVLTHAHIQLFLNATEVWISNYTQWSYVNIIMYPYHKLSAGLANFVLVKKAPFALTILLNSSTPDWLHAISMRRTKVNVICIWRCRLQMGPLRYPLIYLDETTRFSHHICKTRCPLTIMTIIITMLHFTLPTKIVKHSNSDKYHTYITWLSHMFMHCNLCRVESFAINTISMFISVAKSTTWYMTDCCIDV